MKIPLYCACTPLFVCLLLPGGAAGQSRMFGTQPDFLLGLRSDRSASITLADVDGDQDLDVIVANGRHWPQANEVFINNGARAGGRGAYCSRRRLRPVHPGLHARQRVDHQLRGARR